MSQRTPGKRRLSVLTLTTVIASLATDAVAVTPGYAHAARAAASRVHVIEHADTDTDTEIPTGGGKDVKGNILS